MHELAIEGGTVVSPSGRRRANVYVDDGKIAAVTTDRAGAREVIDATGLLVLPGMVDAHVHFMDPGATEREDFPTGSGAAAIAGVTTVIEHTHASPVRTGDDLRTKVKYLRDRSYVDFALAAHAWPGNLDDARSAWGAGAAFLKAFTCTTHGIPGFTAGELHELFRLAADLSATCLLHCEDESLTAHAERTLREAGRSDNAVIPEWRNRDAEIVSLAVVMLLAQRTGAHVIAAHVSHPDALDLIDRARAAGATVAAESCPQYLSLLEEEILEHGAFRKFTPPARARSASELDAMWASLAEGRIDLISSDHAPATPEQKTEGSIWDVHFGLPGIDTTMPILLDGAAAGKLSYERLVEVYAATPARTYRLAHKGRLEPGADADVILVDPDLRWQIADGEIRSRAAWSPFSGRNVRGRTVRTYVRGILVADGGELCVDPGTGRFIRGRGARA